MYLIVIGWMYVVLMMSVAEATNTTGSVLGAIVTFFLYGILPVSIVVYLMRSPSRRKAMKAREAAEDAARAQAALATSTDPDAGGQPAGAAEDGGVTPTALRVDGGMVANDWLMQFLADITQALVERSPMVDVTSLGAAWLAGWKAGVWPDMAGFAQRWALDRQFNPRMDDATRKAAGASLRAHRPGHGHHGA
mgnify:CR=1 FL=1